MASAPSHVSRKTRAHPIVHEFEYNLHIHWFRVQPTLSRQNQPLLNMTLNLFTTEQSAAIGCLRYAQCGKTPRSRSSKCAQSGSLQQIVAVLFVRSDFLWIYLNFYLHLETIIPERCIVFIYNLTVVYFIKEIIIIIQCLLTIRNEYFYCTFLTVLQTVSFGEFLKTVRTCKINYSSCVSFSIVLSNFIGVYLFNNSVKFQIQSFWSYSKTNVARYWFIFV